MAELDVLIVGTGGCGQTYFMQVVSEHLRTNHVHDFDRLKHAPDPFDARFKGYKIKRCVYIYNDPFDAVCSHFRRRWPLIAVSKFGNTSKLSASHVASVETYLALVEKNGRDLFSLDSHFTAWFEARKKTPYPIMFVNFRDMDTTAVAEFIGLDPSKLKIEIKERSDYSCLRAKYPIAVSVYQRLFEKFESMR